MKLVAKTNIILESENHILELTQEEATALYYELQRALNITVAPAYLPGTIWTYPPAPNDPYYNPVTVTCETKP